MFLTVEETSHCPVICPVTELASKWLVGRWSRERGNIFCKERTQVKARRVAFGGGRGRPPTSLARAMEAHHVHDI